VITTGNYNYKGQPTCQNGPAIKDIWSRFVDIPNVDNRIEDVIAFAYVRNTWLDSRLWPPHSWSAFKSSVRTSNDVEGWHNRLNHCSRRGQPDIYQLAPLLHQEAEFVSVQALLVSDAKLRRHQHKEWDSWNFRSRLSTFAPSSIRFVKYQGAMIGGDFRAVPGSESSTP